MQHQNKLDGKELLMIGIACIIIVSIPLIIRATQGSPLLLGDAPYLHLQIAKEITHNRPGEIQGIAAKSGPILPSPYDYLLSILIPIFGEGMTSLALPLSLGVICAVLFHIYLFKIGIPKTLRTITTGLLMLTPLFIYTSIVSDDAVLLLVLQISFFILYLYKRSWSLLLAIIVSSVVTFFGFTHLFVDIGYSIAYYILLERNSKKFFSYFFGVMLILGILLPLSGYEPSQLSIAPMPSLSLITDLGAPIGVSVFLVVLGIIGSALFVRTQPLVFSISWVVFIISLFTSVLQPYATLLLCFFAAYAFVQIFSREWNLLPVRQLSLLLLVCSIIFSTVSYDARVAKLQPNDLMLRSLIGLGVNSNETSVILSAPQNGFYIGSVSGRTPYMDRYTSPQNQKAGDGILHTYNLDYAAETSHKEGITHIYLTPDMVGSVWEAPDQGIMHLLKNNETFKNVYQDGGYGVWAIR